MYTDSQVCIHMHYGYSAVWSVGSYRDMPNYLPGKVQRTPLKFD